MSRAVHFMAGAFPVLGPPESQCLPCREVSGSVVCISPYPSRSQMNYSLKINQSRCTIRSSSIVCSANSGSHRRNNESSRPNRQGYSRKRNWQNEDRDGYDNFEESDMLSSKNGPLLSASSPSRFQATAAPGPREKEIVELFRKVQAKLRERAAVKDEKKVEEPQKKGKESETVDSLLKLLRKHSIKQGKASDEKSNSSDFILDHLVENGSVSEERSTIISNSTSSLNLKHEKPENEAPVVSRPRSNFQRRSPVPQVKFQDYDENSTRSVWVKSDHKIKKKALEPEFEVEPEVDPAFSDDDEFDEISEDEISGIYDDDSEDDTGGDNDVPEPNAAEHIKFGDMKLTELRALAKSRGMKGFSKLKKQELVELLAGV